MLTLHPRTMLALASAAAVLSGCGSSDALVISGTAAKGAPLVGTVAATCVSGNGTATVQSNGSYRVEVINGTGPCLLELTPSGGGSKIYSVSTGSGSETTANITPLTNLFVEYLRQLPGASSGAASVAAWFAKPATQSLLSVPAAVESRATNEFLPLVRSLSGLSTADLPDTTAFLSTTFTATPTNTQDAALEKLAGTQPGATTTIFQSTGQPTATVVTQTQTAAVTNPPVATVTTGATGATGGN